MKNSRYNIIVKNNEKSSICYNTRLDSFCILSNGDAELLKHDIELLAEKSPKAYEAMSQAGFIVQDDCDEIDLAAHEYDQAINDSSTFYLTILPSLDCNLRCWYCFEKHVVGSRMSQDVSDAIFALVKEKLADENIKQLYIDLFGGEPLLYFETDLYPLLKKIKEMAAEAEKVVYFFFVTNAVCINDKNIPLFNELNAYFQISIDGSKERHDKVKFIPETGEGTFDSMLKTVKALTEMLDNTYINLRINYDDETLPKIPELIEQLGDIDRNKLGVHLERVWQTRSPNLDNKILQEIIHQWISSGFKVSYMNMGRRSFSCKASAKNQVVISWDGAVYKCTGRDFTDSHKEGQLIADGTIKWDEDKLKKRLDIVTWDNPMCRECKFLPLCWGPCCQKQLETPKDLERHCQKRVMEISIVEFVKYKFNNAYINPANEIKKI